MSKVLIYSFLFICLGCQTKKAAVQSKGTTRSIEKDTIAVNDNPKNKKLENEYSLEVKIGQMILIGLNDRKAIESTDSLLEEIRLGKVGSIILFEKNIASENSSEKLTKLISSLQAQAKIPLLVSIDEEGGKVHRLKSKYGFIDVPSAQYLGSKDNLDSTFYYAKILGEVLFGLGINMNFAPDLDVAFNPNNPVIAKVGRSYSDNPEKVYLHGLAAIKGYHAAQVKTAIKHFPGHGSSMNDSHLGLTDVTKLWKKEELLPFKSIIESGHCDAIMTAHIVNRNLDSTSLPATLSKPVVTDLLRGKYKFEGVVFSDDMQMYAISKNYGLENAIKLAIQAGVDILLFGNNVNQSDRITATEIHAIISKLVSSGEISEERINQSFERIMKLKAKKIAK